MKTSGNIVLITGGTSGIGLALAKKFIAEGNEVIVTGTNAEKAEAVKKQLPNIKIELDDIRDRIALDRLVFKYPNVNILINNVGIQYNYNFADTAISPAQIDTELDINLIAPLYLTKIFLPSLLTKPTAAIINVSSGLAIVPKRRSSRG
jgi:uncharacterized oxidoreductase